MALEIYGTFMGTSVLQANRIRCLSIAYVYFFTTVSKQGI